MGLKNKLYKLERVERSINIYRNKDEPELIEEVRIDIPIEKLKDVVSSKEDDPLLYKGYILDAKQLEQLNNTLGGVINPDFDLYYYVLECHGIYDW